MKTRIDLHNKLKELFGSDNIYYQPPTNINMAYPAIKYSKHKKNDKFADDIKYIKENSYEIIVIDQEPDNPVINKILELPYSYFDRSYISDNLNHDVIILYF